jgi:hypothetical protein
VVKVTEGAVIYAAEPICRRLQQSGAAEMRTPGVIDAAKPRLDEAPSVATAMMKGRRLASAHNNSGISATSMPVHLGSFHCHADSARAKRPCWHTMLAKNQTDAALKPNGAACFTAGTTVTLSLNESSRTLRRGNTILRS